MVQTDDTIIAGVSELRKHLPELVLKLEGNKVIVTKRGNPVAVLQSYTQYQTMKGELERQENEELLDIALQRDKEKTYSEKEMKTWLNNFA
jgi:prevent-host-death family protein